MTKVIYLDEQLPPVNVTVVFVVVNVDIDNTNSKLAIDYDLGVRDEDDDLLLSTDWGDYWNEGQNWAIVGWMPVPELPNEEEIRKHKINWKK